MSLYATAVKKPVTTALVFVAIGILGKMDTRGDRLIPL